jgi:WhiB family transcriptional regulator, redox-sensing transcriptional regulator
VIGPMPEWMEAAACRSTPTQRGLFFPPDAIERKEDRVRRESKAKAICRACPAQETCLAWAIRHRELFGIWGGTTELERRVMGVA